MQHADVGPPCVGKRSFAHRVDPDATPAAMSPMVNLASEFHATHTRPSGTVRAIVVCALVFVTAVVAGRFALAQGSSGPKGYAQSELRRANPDNPAETRNRSYATDELGRVIVQRHQTTPLYHGSNGQTIEYNVSVDDSQYIGFDGRPLDDPFRLGLGQGQTPLAETGYYGSNGQPVEFESGDVGVYGTNGAPIDPAVLNGVPLGGTPSSTPISGEQAGARADGVVLGGTGLFRPDRVKHHGTSAVAASKKREDRPSGLVVYRPLRSLLNDNAAEADDTPTLSPLLPLLNYDDDGDSYELAERESNGRSKNEAATYEQPATQRPAFGTSPRGAAGQAVHSGTTGYQGTSKYFTRALSRRRGALSDRTASSGQATSGGKSVSDNAAAEAKLHRWSGRSGRGLAVPSSGSSSFRSSGT